MKEHRRSLPTTENRTCARKGIKVIAERFSCGLILFAILLLPAQGAKGADFPLFEEREQELVSSEDVRELARIHYARARNYYRKGEYTRAKAEFEQVLKLEPEHQGACWYLRCVEKELVKYEQTFRGRMEKLREKRKSRTLKAALDSIEQRSIEKDLRLNWQTEQKRQEEQSLYQEQQAYEKKLDQERTIRKQLERERSGFLKQLEEYEEQQQQAAKKEEKLRLKREAEARRQEQARLKKEKARLEKEQARLQKEQARKAQKEEKLRQKQEKLAKAKAEKEKRLAQLKAEKEERLAKLRQEKEARERARQDELARLKAEKEEKLRLRREAEARRQEQARLEKEQARLEKEQARKAKKEEKLRQKQEKLAKAKAEKQEHLRLKREAREKRRELTRLQEEKNRLEAKVKEAETEKEKLTTELEKLRQNQEAKLRDKLKEYEQSLREKFDQRIADELNEKINSYEAKLKRSEAKIERLEQTAQRLEQAQTEQAKLKAELSELRKGQQTQLKGELKKYENVLEDRIAQKESELNKKISSYEAKLAQLEEGRQKLEGVRAQIHKDTLQLEEAEEAQVQLKTQAGQLRRAQQAQLKDELGKYGQALQQKLARKEAELDEKIGLYAVKIEQLQRSQWQEAEQLDFHLSEGRYYYKEEDYQKAKEEFNQALTLDYKNEQARAYIHKIDKAIKKEEAAQRQAEQRALVQARKNSEELKARLKEQQARKAKEERLAKAKAEKEKRLAQLKAEKETHLAQLKAEKEESLAKLRQEKEARERAHQDELARLKAEEEERLAQLKAEKEEKLRLERAAEAKRQEEARLKQEQARLKEKQARKAKQERLARLKAEKQKQAEEEALKRAQLELAKNELQKKIKLHYVQGKKHFQDKDYIAAEKEFKDILILDPKNKYAINALEKVKATQAKDARELQRKQKEQEQAERAKRQQIINQHLAQGKIYSYQQQHQQAIEEFEKILFFDPNNSLAEKYILRSRKALAEAKRQEQARLKEEQARKAKEERLAKAKDEKEKGLAKLKAEKEERLAKLKAEKEERLAKLRQEKEARERARQEELARLKAEKKEQLRLKRAAEAKRQEEKRLREEQARLEKEQARRAKEEKLAQLKAEMEEKLRLERAAEAKRQEEARLKEEQARLKQKQARKAKEERLARLRAEKQKQAEEEALKRAQLELAKQAKIKAQREEELARLKAKKEEKLRRKQEKLAKLKAKQERLAKLKAEKEEKLRLRREAPAKRQEEKRLKEEQARLKEEQARKAKQERLAKLKAEKQRKRNELQKKIKLHYVQGKKHFQEKDYIAAEKEFKDILILDPKNKYAINALEKVKATQARDARELQRKQQEREEAERTKRQEIMNQHLAQGKIYSYQQQHQQAIDEFEKILFFDPNNSLAEKYILHSRKALAEAKRQEQARLKEEQARKAKEERLAKAKAEQRLKAEQERQLQEKANLRLAEGKYYYKEKDYQKAKEAFNQALALDYKNEQARAYIRKIEKAIEKEEAAQRQAKRRTLAQARKNLEEVKSQLRKEQVRKAKEERLAKAKAEKEKRLAKAKAEKEEKLRLRREAEAEAEQRLKTEQERQLQEKANLHLAEGKYYYREEEYQKAKEAFNQALTLDYKNEQARAYIRNIEKAIEKEEAKRLREEKQAEEQALKGAQLEWAQLAKMKARAQDLARLRAEKELKQRKQAQEDEQREKLRSHFAQGKMHYYLKDYEQAIAEFRQVLLIEPTYSSAVKYIRKCQEGIEEQKQRELEDRKKNAARLKKTAGLIKEEKEKEKLEKIRELYKKGKSYFGRGLYSEAIACFEKVIELEGNPRLHYTPQASEYIERAGIEMKDKEKEDARKIAEEQIKRKKAEQAEKLKAQERAREQVHLKEEEAIRKYYKQGKIYYRQGNYPLAIAEFNKIKQFSPEHSYVSSAEDYIQKCRQKIMQSEETALKAEMKKEARTLKAEELVARENLLPYARQYYRRGDYEQAIKVCRAALELDPLNRKVRDLLYTAELKHIRKEQKQADKEKDISEQEMMVEVAQRQVLPEQKTRAVIEKEITPLVKVPVIREKLKNPLTVDFRDVDLSYVLNFLADSTGVNIIPASGVSLEGKKVTIRMKDIPAENALKYILKNQGLTYRIEKDAVWVASPGEMNKEETESRVYFLNRGSGMFTEFERMVGTGTGLGGAPAISKITTVKDTLEQAVDWPKDSKLVLDERSGALIISNTPSNLKVIEDILYNLDITPMQVLIEARFVELTVTDVEQLGIEWATTAALGDKRRDGENVTQWESGLGWDFTSFTRATEGLNLTYTGVLTYPEFQSVLHALSERQNAKTLSAPKVTTLNNQMATIKVVDEWIYPTRYEFQVVQSDVNGDGDFDDANETKYQNVPVDFITKDVGILLHVTPNVGADGRTITLALVPEVSEGTADYFSYTGSVSLPKFSSRTLSTSVVINNGDTVALGGLVKETTTKTVTKVPFLGDIPILGHLFRKKSDSVVRKNLLIFVTATILNSSGEKLETVFQQ